MKGGQKTMILCNVCLTREALVVAEGRLYCPSCFLASGPKFIIPQTIRAPHIERRKYARGILPEGAHGLLPEDYDDAKMP